MATTASSPLTPIQRAALDDAEGTKARLLEAQEHLYHALRRPQPTRERRWAADVSGELAAAVNSIHAHREEVERSEGLYAELLRDAPWAAPRLRQFAAQLKRIEAEAVDLQVEVARVEAGDLQALGPVRADAERLLLAVRDLLNKEADIIYERFRDVGAWD
jgi:hypothetical protein